MKYKIHLIYLICFVVLKTKSQTAGFNPNNTYKIQNQNGFIELGNSTIPTTISGINPITGIPFSITSNPIGNQLNYYQINTNKNGFSFGKNIISETGLFSSTISTMQFNFIGLSKTTSPLLPVMIITKLNGKVGIGHPDANNIIAKLDIVNNDKITSLKTQSNYTSDLISANVFSINRDKTKAIVVLNSNNNKENFVVMGNGATHIGEKWGNGQYKDAMLSVYGQVVARSFHVTIDPSSWADYVFSENYKLLSLKELEAFYKTNKHLPEVPSEDEVLQNGVDINKMQILLLKKIEELTLYIVEQQKEIEELKNKNKNE